ncbi:hypothetical protein [Celeribacter persicus]|jgi:hypothetical protein|uniref:Uncharacterized protein n=1 Tax=Celeribacter persicus TaxID=1651082 RepID=A0A2T5HJY5_9RHOB|nr:hypothetical protein [Celeribacter persicus]PTQ71890.1 hypothetical protein C8N42_10769 [Celeribacter persicus]
MANTPNDTGIPLTAANLLNSKFLTGAVVGGLVTYVLTNEAVQKAALNGLAHLWITLQGGVEEAKERFRDAESEIKAARDS